MDTPLSRRPDPVAAHRLELGDRAADALHNENSGTGHSRLTAVVRRFTAEPRGRQDLCRLAHSLAEAIRRGDAEAVDRLQRTLGSRRTRRSQR